MLQIVGPYYRYNAEELADLDLGRRRAEEFYATYTVTVGADGIPVVERKMEAESQKAS